MKRIAIIAFNEDWSPVYSITSVVKNQIRVLVSKGYSVRVLTRKECPPWLFKDKVDYRGCLPSLFFSKEKDKANSIFHEDVNCLSEIYIDNLQDVDVVFSHDIIFMYMFLKHNIAFRKAARKLNNIHCIHWTHSCARKRPSKQLHFPYSKLYEGMPNSKYVSLSKEQVVAIARMYNVPEEKVSVVYNTRMNQDFLQLDPLSKKVIEKFNLFNADIVCTMPTTLSRMFKQHEVCIYIMAALKAEGKTVRMVFANACEKSNKELEMKRMLQLMWLAQKIGLSESDVVYTSDVAPELRSYAPEIVVRDLQNISNIYINASLGESFGLVLLEAVLSKTLCVLSEEIPVFKEIVGGNAIWIKGVKLAREIIEDNNLEYLQTSDYNLYYNYYLKNKEYYRQCAKRILKELASNKSLSLFLKVKQECNNEEIFNKQLKPLLESD